MREKEIKLPKMIPAPLQMDKVYDLHGHKIKVSYFNKGRQRGTFQYLGIDK